MTATSDRLHDEGLATVPWPFVERRRVPRTGSAGEQVGARVGVPEQRRSSLSVDPPPLTRPASRGWRSRLVAAAVATDAAAAVVAALVAYLLRFDAGGPDDRYLLGVLIAPAVWLAAVALARGYEARWFGSGSEEFRCVFRAALLVAAGSATVSYALHAELARGYLVAACVLGGAGSVAGRIAGRAVLHAARRRGRAMVDVLLVGSEAAVLDLARHVLRGDNGGLRLAGACLPAASSPALEALGVPILGDLHDTSAVVRRLSVDTVAVAACAEMGGPGLRRLAWELEGTGVDLVVSPGLVEVAGPRLHIRPLCGLPLLHVEEPELAGTRRLVKAGLDRVGSLLGLVLLSPLLLIVAVLVRSTSPGPVLFTQTRVGKDGREFRLWKFRTMHQDAEQRLAEVMQDNVHGREVLFKLRRDPRVTTFGRWLRRFSLDELPQLLNVLLGQMSLVGPRPPLPREVARYGDGVHRRLLVKPGLTGLWQIRGRSDLSWDESIRLDLRYVENWSLALDLLIIYKTFAAVLGGRGAY